MNRRRTVLRVERLEDRCTPATWGNPWPDPGHLTLSFAPDGTMLGGQPSNLFQTLNGSAPTSAWEMQILRAFQTWAVEANINIGVVTDQGLPFGSSGAIQGDARFGDIRVGAYAMPLTALAITSPFAVDAGTWSGDVQLNTAASFSVSGANGSAYDLFSVLLHEAGHAFGLPDSSDPTSVMYEDYHGVRTGLSAGDISALQAIYGARNADTAGNDQLETATNLTLLANPDGSLGMTVAADIASLQDRDFYSFQTLLNVGGVDVTVQTGGSSLLAPRVTIYNAWGNVVAANVSTDPLQGGFVIHLSNVQPLSTYYVAVDSGRQDVFGIGSYQLTIHELPLLNTVVGTATSTLNQLISSATTFLIDTLPLNDSFATAMTLSPQSATGAARFDYAYRGNISNSSDVDYFRVQAPVQSGSSDILTAMVWGAPGSNLNGRVRVYDSDQNLVPARVVVNDGFSYTIQVPDAVAGASYYIVVSAANPQGNQNTGGYTLAVDFAQPAVNLQTLAGGIVGASQPAVDTLSVSQDQMYHLLLSCAAANSSVQMTIVDRSGQVVFSLVAGGGEPETANVILKAGTYSLRFAVAAGSTAPPPGLGYQLAGSIITDPIGPDSTDPTQDPSMSSPPPSSTTDSSGGTSSSGVSSQDPSSDPYSTTSGSGTYSSTTTTSSTSSTSGSSGTTS